MSRSLRPRPAASSPPSPPPDRVSGDQPEAPAPSTDAPLAPSLYLDPIPKVIDFGTVNIFAGAPGVGKTTLFAEWAGRFRDGRSICGHPTNRPIGLDYLSTDRGGHSTKKLLALHNLLDDGYTQYYNPLDDPTFDRELMRNASQALTTLRYCLSKIPIRPGSQLCLDPAAPLFVPGSQNDPRAVAALLWELHVIARERMATIFVLAHFAKQLADASQRYTRPQDRISGSGAWSGFSDTQMYMVDPEPPAAPYHGFGWNPRHAPPQDFKFLRQGQFFVPYKSLDDVGVRTKIPRKAYELFCLIPDEGCDTDNLLTAASVMLQMSRTSFFRHLKTLENLGVIERPHGFVKRVSLEEVQPVEDSESEGKPH